MANAHLFRPGLGLPTATIHDDRDVPWGYYFYTIREDDLIRELRFINVIDPSLSVQSMAPDGSLHPWTKYTEDDYTVFIPNEFYKGEMDMPLIHFNPLVQRFIAAPRTILERAALGNRTSVNF